MSAEKLKTAMILAAGFGTRLKPLTDNMPKALIPYNGKPMIDNVISKLIASGIERVVINTHYFAEKVEAHFAETSFNAEIILVNESEILGTGGGIKNAEQFLQNEDNFLVYNVDVDCGIDLERMFQNHLSQKPIATLAVKKRLSSKYLLIDSAQNLVGRTENGKNVMYRSSTGPVREFGFCGIHILSKRSFEYFPFNSGFDIIPAYMQMLQKGMNILAYDIGETMWKDLGKP